MLSRLFDSNFDNKYKKFFLVLGISVNVQALSVFSIKFFLDIFINRSRTAGPLLRYVRLIEGTNNY